MLELNANQLQALGSLYLDPLLLFHFSISEAPEDRRVIQVVAWDFERQNQHRVDINENGTIFDRSGNE